MAGTFDVTPHILTQLYAPLDNGSVSGIGALLKWKKTWRKIQSLGLTTVYQSNEDVRHFIGVLDGLAFLPLKQLRPDHSVASSSPLAVMAQIGPFTFIT
ncbi:hypothetical protein LSH36_19g06006 [Paralvinella palmiformis]|uniref:Uncharacterized protein n=1 Tax=Paralvinella palmiformis TaxID=53620 RepID=A0AAD9KAP5_9ANNE|nr:hypothetical protein LSH36_19g06006 [Paralvinella palmiformis]